MLVYSRSNKGRPFLWRYGKAWYLHALDSTKAYMHYLNFSISTPKADQITIYSSFLLISGPSSFSSNKLPTQLRRRLHQAVRGSMNRICQLKTSCVKQIKVHILLYELWTRFKVRIGWYFFIYIMDGKCNVTAFATGWIMCGCVSNDEDLLSRM